MSRQLETLLNALERATGAAATRAGGQWRSRCPAHDDRVASLSVGASENGRILVHCHAGCQAEAICLALDLTISDLMPEDDRVQQQQQRGPTDHRLPSERGRAVTVADSVLPAADSFLPRSLGNVWKPPRVSAKSATIYETNAHAWRAAERIAGRPPSTSWEYHDRAGQLIGMVLRWDNPGGGKEIRPLARVEKGWIIGAMAAPRPLYRLSEIAPRLAEDEWIAAPRVYVVEGEKAAEAGRSIGVACTTSAGGAASAHLTDWSPLAGRQVVVLPDNDDPGRKYAAAVVAQLVKLKPLPTIRQVRLAELPPGGDLADFVAARSDQPPELIAAALAANVAFVAPITSCNPFPHEENPMTNEVTSANAAAISNKATATAPEPRPLNPEPSQRPQSEAVTVRLSECVSTPLRWLWPGRVPKGKLTLLVGDPGLGKSFVTLDIAARVSRGEALPRFDSDAPAGSSLPGSVVLLSAEDDVADTIRPRLVAAGADLSRIVAIEAVRLAESQSESTFSLAHDLDVLERVVRSLDHCSLVVIDPITAYLGRSDSHKNAEIRALLAPLSELAARTGVAVLAINHLNKMGQGPAIYRSMGSLAFAATARSVLAVFADPHDAAARTLVPVKSNVAAPVDGIGFRMAPAEGDAMLPSNAAATPSPAMPIVHWSTTPIRMSADEILHAAAQNAGLGPAVDEAAEWLASVLTAGPQTAADLKAKAKEDGIHERTLLRAKARLRVVTSREGFGLGGNWRWALPKA